jgi:hypothetical protein
MQRNWLGGGGNKATNPQDWSPNGTPQPGDSLFAEGAVGIDPFPVYTLNVKGNDLAGDTLTTFFANVTVNASHRAILNVVDSNGTDTFNLSGRSALNLNVSDIHLIFGGFSTVNMRDDSTLHLTNGGQTTVNVLPIQTGREASIPKASTVASSRSLEAGMPHSIMIRVPHRCLPM